MLVGNLGGARQLVGGKLRAVHAAAVAVAALEDRRPDVLGSWRVPDLVGLILLEVADRDRQPGRTAEVHVAPLVGVDLFERRQAEAAAQVRLGLAARPPVEPLDEQVVLVVRHRAVGERQRLVAIVVVQRVHGRDNEQQLRGRTARGREAVERQAQPEILLVGPRPARSGTHACSRLRAPRSPGRFRSGARGGRSHARSRAAPRGSTRRSRSRSAPGHSRCDAGNKEVTTHCPDHCPRPGLAGYACRPDRASHEASHDRARLRPRRPRRFPLPRRNLDRRSLKSCGGPPQRSAIASRWCRSRARC